MARLLLLVLLAACRPRVVAPAFEAPLPGPFWPPAPDAPRVAWVGEIRAPVGRFLRPLDVACGQGHRIAVADVDAGVVWVLDLADGRWFRVASADGEPFQAPVGVAFDGGGSLLVSDSARAAIFRGRGDRKGRLHALPTTPALTRPTALTPRPDGTVLVVDTGAHGLVRVEPDGRATPVGAGRGVAGQGFNFPVDVAVGAGGDLYVADALNALVQRVTGGGPEPVAGGPGDGGERLVRPKGVAIDEQGRIHVVDAGMQHVQVYDAGGRLLGRYGGPGSGPGQLGLPSGICIDGDHHVFVADSVNGRIQAFELLEGG